MTLQEAHYKFTLQMNRMNTNTNFDFNPAEIDFLLNEAQLVFIKQRFQGTSEKRGVFESVQKRIDDLSPIVIKNESTQVNLIHTDDLIELPLSSLNHTYLFLVSIRAKINVNNCEKTVPIRFVEHFDINESHRNPFSSPSEHEIRCSYGMSSSSTGTSIYVHKGDLVVDDIIIDYIKYPTRVNLGTYVYLDNIVHPQSNLSVSEQAHEEVVDIACQLAAINIDNPQLLELKSFKNNKHE